ALPVGVGLGQLGGERFGNRASRKLAGRAQSDTNNRLVRRTQRFEQQGKAIRLSRKDRSPGGFENSLLRQIRLANGVVQLGCFGKLLFREEMFCAEDATLCHSRPRCARATAESFLQRL